MNWSAIGAVFLALAVGLGAFGAHGLKDRLDAYSLGIWEKAVFYHFIHSLGVLVVSLLPRTGTFPINAASSVCWLLAAGVLIFSGSLYTLALDRRADNGRHHAHRRRVFYRGMAAAGLLLHRTKGVTQR